jgi:hypothetical protein
VRLNFVVRFEAATSTVLEAYATEGPVPTARDVLFGIDRPEKERPVNSYEARDHNPPTFHAFACIEYERRGGMDDYQGAFHSVEEARKAVEAFNEVDYGQVAVVDPVTGRLKVLGRFYARRPASLLRSPGGVWEEEKPAPPAE